MPVATVPTVYGIETLEHWHMQQLFVQLQQYLPFTVLKPIQTKAKDTSNTIIVATVPTVYGIETKLLNYTYFNTIIT